jgi:hypothetical protein
LKKKKKKKKKQKNPTIKIKKKKKKKKKKKNLVQQPYGRRPWVSMSMPIAVAQNPA